MLPLCIVAILFTRKSPPPKRRCLQYYFTLILDPA